MRNVVRHLDYPLSAMSVSLNPLGEDFEQGFFRKAESFIANTALEIEEGIASTGEFFLRKSSSGDSPVTLRVDRRTAIGPDDDFPHEVLPLDFSAEFMESSNPAHAHASAVDNQIGS